MKEVLELEIAIKECKKAVGELKRPIEGVKELYYLKEKQKTERD